MVHVNCYITAIHVVEKSSFLGGKKDYWNYFIEGLNSVKGVADGLKFVKAHNEVKLTYFVMT